MDRREAVMREKAILKLRKIKVLALSGVGGEKTGAQKTYEDLKSKYQITEAEVEEAMPEPKKRQQLSFAMAIMQQQLHDEHLLCHACWEENGRTEECEGCSTRENLRDLHRQYEQMAAEAEGRRYGK